MRISEQLFIHLMLDMISFLLSQGQLYHILSDNFIDLFPFSSRNSLFIASMLNYNNTYNLWVPF